MAGRFVPLLAVACGASWALGAEDLPPARVRVTDPIVTLQSASDAAAEEAVPNLPFLPGDRVWSDANGRVEFHFGDGSRLRLDRRSKLDYQSLEGDGDGTAVLRLWSGSAYVQQGRSTRLQFAIETPNGTAVLREGGAYRVDVTGGETRLSVYEGEGTLDAGEQLRVRPSERAFARRGARPWGPERFDRAEDDAFARWNAELGEDAMWASSGGALPEEVSPYAEDLARNGSWYVEAGVGSVWRPNVSIGWQPYVHGRWAWTAYGWTWVPNEPWGWAPYHYGSWDHSSSIGWYWIPGRTWGPAWVDWSVNGSHVGWRPHGYGGHHGGGHGNAVPRGSGRDGWTYVRRADLGAPDVAARRVAREVVGGSEMRIVEGTRGRLGRDLSVADGQQAVPRNVRTRPGPGDTVEELRSDPMTTIPFPVARRKYESAREREREREQQNNPSLAPRSRTGGSGVRPEASPETTTWERRRTRPSGEEAAPAQGAAARPRGGDGDREALRPWFRSLSRPRAEDESQARPAREREREAQPAREEERRRPERVSPPPPTESRGESQGESRGGSRGGQSRERSGGQSRGGGSDGGGGAVRRDH
jgi:uncharacterized membrane protein YgcG